MKILRAGTYGLQREDLRRYRSGSRRQDDLKLLFCVSSKNSVQTTVCVPSDRRGINGCLF
jgi:hypothetical protein